jgi:hypothetical protein
MYGLRSTPYFIPMLAYKALRHDRYQRVFTLANTAASRSCCALPGTSQLVRS